MDPLSIPSSSSSCSDVSYSSESEQERADFIKAAREVIERKINAKQNQPVQVVVKDADKFASAYSFENETFHLNGVSHPSITATL